jgi:carbonic anhydrase
MKKIFLSMGLIGVLVCSNPFCWANEVHNLSADEAMTKLLEGNKRFYTKHLKHPDQSYKRRIEGLKGQHPFVVILTCSDSRVAPEIIFDEGLGDIFEVRNAGNIIDEHVIGSIEYAVEHLGVNLVVVMGHDDCGAVKAAMNHKKESVHIESLVKSIEPAVLLSKQQTGDFYQNCIKNNVKLGTLALKSSKPVISKHLDEQTLKIFSAIYHIDTGKVELWK